MCISWLFSIGHSRAQFLSGQHSLWPACQSITQPKLELARMHIHPEGWEGPELPLGSHDGPCLLAHLRGGYWALTLGGPLSLTLPCGQGTQTLPAVSRWSALLSSLIYLKSLKFEKRWEGDGILYSEMCLSKGTYHWKPYVLKIKSTEPT